MRLLHFDAQGRLRFTDYRGKTIPPYAILSHRWSDSEVLFEDIAGEAYKSRQEGYRKLKFCAEQAAQDGLKFFWIDSTCIDRWNVRERSRAINSMFQWYKNASRCYVFLSDVAGSSVTSTPQRSDWEALFRASAWFTRGWTLQELIAPVSVEFFSQEGRRIGDKASLDQLLQDITGIPLAALRNSPLDQFRISERLQWVKDRRTTEEEDIVYCLLGILGVSMPSTYGEGKENALRRLQAELEAASSAPSIIPFSRNESFVGREYQLTEAEATLFSDKQTTAALAILGPGGTGKSQLALEIAHRTRQNNKVCSVFWIDASDDESVFQSYARIAQKIGVLDWDDNLPDMKQVVRRCVAELSARQCLLIFDNAEDTILHSVNLAVTEAADLANCLPQSRSCSVIFTTTSSGAAQAFAPQNAMSLQELTPDAALSMLQNHLVRPISDTEQQEAKELLKDLSNLPLAVVQAAACMNAGRIKVQDYRAQLSEYKESTLLCDSTSSEDRRQRSGVVDPIAAVLALSLEYVTRENPLATDYLYIAACVARKDVPLELLESSSPQAREDAVKFLDKYALITRRPAESALDLHQLVHQALQNRLQAQGQLEYWSQRAKAQLHRIFPNGDRGDRSKWRRLFQHAQYALSHSPTKEYEEEGLGLARKYAMALYNDGRFKDAEVLQVRVMLTRMNAFGDKHHETLTSMNNLAATYSLQGRWKEAEELQVHVMRVRESILGNEHPDTLTSINNLAVTYRDQGRWEEAEELQLQVMQTRKRVLGTDHPNTLTSMYNLALTYSKQGRWKEAEELQLEELQAVKKILGNEHAYTLTSMAGMALTYSRQGRYCEAEDLQTQEIQMRKRVQGEKHPSTLTSMNNLALTYWNQGRWREAEELQLHETKTTRRILGDEHPNTLASLNNLALTYWSQGRFSEAEELQVRVLEMRERVLGNIHPDTLTSMYTVAYTLQSQGRCEEAVGLMEKCLQLREQVLGKHHPDTESSLDTLNDWRATCNGENQ